MRQRVARQGVHPDLEHDDVRVERPHDRQDAAVERLDEGRVVRSHRQRQVHAEAVPLAMADVALEARTWEERPPALVHRHGHHVAPVVEGVLDTIAVVGVDVEEEDPTTSVGQRQAGEHDVVDVAEAGGARRVGVVEAAGGVEHDLGLAGQDQLGTRDRPAGREAHVVEHVREERAVGRAEAHRQGGEVVLAAPAALEGVEVARVVEAFHFGAGQLHRRDDPAVGAVQEAHAGGRAVRHARPGGVEGAARRVASHVQGIVEDEGLHGAHPPCSRPPTPSASGPVHDRSSTVIAGRIPQHPGPAGPGRTLSGAAGPPRPAASPRPGPPGWRASGSPRAHPRRSGAGCAA